MDRNGKDTVFVGKQFNWFLSRRAGKIESISSGTFLGGRGGVMGGEIS